MPDAIVQPDALALRRCCGSTRWVEAMLARRPFASKTALHQAAEEVWNALAREDWLEAFAAHPRIGDMTALRQKFAATADLCGTEQAGVAGAAEQMLRDLAEANQSYEERFGYIFIVCATGKTASEMLDLLRVRLNNDPETEITIAAGEQAKITRLRLEKL